MGQCHLNGRALLMQLTQLHHYAQIIKLFCVEKKGVLTVGNFRLPDFNFIKGNL